MPMSGEMGVEQGGTPDLQQNLIKQAGGEHGQRHTHSRIYVLSTVPLPFMVYSQTTVVIVARYIMRSLLIASAGEAWVVTLPAARSQHYSSTTLSISTPLVLGHD